MEPHYFFSLVAHPWASLFLVWIIFLSLLFSLEFTCNCIEFTLELTSTSNGDSNWQEDSQKACILRVRYPGPISEFDSSVPGRRRNEPAHDYLRKGMLEMRGVH